MSEPARARPQALPACSGKLTKGRSLAEVTWLRVGGPAEWYFQPEGPEDLASFMRDLDATIPVFVLGAGSNLVVRDGGLRGVVIRLGRQFAGIEMNGNLVKAGAAALDSRVAVRAAEAGLDLTFLRTIPGTIGGAVFMNAGCYGSYLEHVCREIRMITRTGDFVTMPASDAGFRYRGSMLPEGAIVIEATLECPEDDPAALLDRMRSQVEYRNQSQPTGIRTAGSTFRNPSGWSSTGPADEDHVMKAWKLIDDAGMRGVCHGHACVSTKHPNFLINTGGATATEIEELGEMVRARVLANSGIKLEWEVLRVGEDH